MAIANDFVNQICILRQNNDSNHNRSILVILLDIDTKFVTFGNWVFIGRVIEKIRFPCVTFVGVCRIVCFVGIIYPCLCNHKHKSKVGRKLATTMTKFTMGQSVLAGFVYYYYVGSVIEWRCYHFTFCKTLYCPGLYSTSRLPGFAREGREGGREGRREEGGEGGREGWREEAREGGEGGRAGGREGREGREGRDGRDGRDGGEGER